MGILYGVTAPHLKAIFWSLYRALRIITGAIIRTPTQALLNESGFETLKTRRERNIILFFHKIIKSNVPTYLYELKPETTNRGRYNLRRPNDFIPPQTRITKYLNSFLPKAVSLWNKLDENVKEIQEYESFKAAMSCKQKDNPLAFIGNRDEQILMARLRLNCSNLKSHLFNLKIIDNPLCSCGQNVEDTTHYFFTCPLYYRPRVALHNFISNLAPFTSRTLLHGIDNFDYEQNHGIIKATLTFIKETGRFNN